MANDVAKILDTDQTLPFYQPRHQEVELFEYAWRNQLPVLLKGPTGCGKTRFIEHMAARLGRLTFNDVQRLLAGGERSVSELEDLLTLQQPTVSQLLAAQTSLSNARLWAG